MEGALIVYAALVGALAGLRVLRSVWAFGLAALPVFVFLGFFSWSALKDVDFLANPVSAAVIVLYCCFVMIMFYLLGPGVVAFGLAALVRWCRLRMCSGSSKG